MFTISPNFSFTRLNNPEFTALLLNVQKLIESTDYEQLGITSVQITSLRNNLKKMVDQTYVSTASPFTKAMNAADEDRSRVFRRIRLKLSTVEVADEGSDLAQIAEEVQLSLLSKYGSKVAIMPMQEKTAVIQGFLLDVRTKLDEDAMGLLGIESDLVALEQANANFVSAHTDRTSERAVMEAERTATLRSELTDTYQRLTFALQYFANNEDDEQKEKASACQSFIKTLNVLLTEAKKRLDARKKQNGEDDGTDEGGSGSGSGNTSGSGSGNGSGSGTGNTAGSGSGSGSSANGSGNGSANGGSTSPGGPTLDDDMIAW